MPEMYLKQIGFTYNVCGPFTKNKKRIEKFIQRANTDFIYKNDLHKDAARRTQSDKVLRDKAFEIAKIQNMMDIIED